MIDKKFRIAANDMVDLAPGHGGCLATDMITVDGMPVMYMYREPPATATDSGWRFFSGLESDEYMSDSSKHAVYDVNTIANYDPTIVPFLYAPVGAQFEKEDPSSQFRLVSDSG